MAGKSPAPAQMADGKLSGQAIHKGSNGAPILDTALAAVECKVTSIVEQGDHHIIVGEVTEAHLPKPIEGRPRAGSSTRQSFARGTPAVEAAGAIHTDIQRGFIRAEVVAYDDLMASSIGGRSSRFGCSTISMRRFFCLFSGVSLGATGS